MFLRPAPIKEPEQLASGPINCPAGQETVLINVNVYNGLWPYLTHLAFFVNGATSLVEFRVYIGNSRASFPWAARKTQLGAIGNPLELPFPEQVPPGVPVKITVNNADVAAFSCECDGYVNYYDKRIR